MADDEFSEDFLRHVAQTLGPALALIAAVGGSMAEMLTQNVGPLVRAVAIALQNLRETCPEAFGDDGQLRPDWQTIVQAKADALASVQPPEFHLELATRKVEVYLN